jgi:hypothetical protein
MEYTVHNGFLPRIDGYAFSEHQTEFHPERTPRPLNIAFIFLESS